MFLRSELRKFIAAPGNQDSDPVEMTMVLKEVIPWGDADSTPGPNWFGRIGVRFKEF